jgi:hypothetical protein
LRPVALGKGLLSRLAKRPGRVCTEWKNLFSLEIYGKDGKLDLTVWAAATASSASLGTKWARKWAHRRLVRGNTLWTTTPGALRRWRFSTTLKPDGKIPAGPKTALRH